MCALSTRHTGSGGGHESLDGLPECLPGEFGACSFGVRGPDLSFADGDYVGYLPFAGGLEGAAKDHFAFMTATEGAPTPQHGGSRPRAAGSQDGRGESGSAASQADRLTKLEEMMERLMVKVDSSLSPSGPYSSQPRPSALRPPKDVSRRSSTVAGQFPDLDPSVVAAAVTVVL